MTSSASGWRSRRLVVIGDALLDRELEGRVERLCPDAPVPVLDDPVGTSRPGGAALAAILAARGDREVSLVCSLGRDAAGDELGALLAERVNLVDLGTEGSTGEKVRVRGEGLPLLRIDYGQAGAPTRTLTAEERSAIADAGAVLVSDYGRGIARDNGIRQVLASLDPRIPIVWDPHPRGPAPVPGARLVTPNEREAAQFTGGSPGRSLRENTERARRLGQAWRASVVAITLGERGALLVQGDDPPLVVPASGSAGDTNGAGDCFAATATAHLADGAIPSEAVVAAVAAAGDYVREGLPTRPTRPPSSASTGIAAAGEVFERARARGGTTVATGGCFDILHAGHIRTLEGARSLGDCLVVCLNSDASVRTLKGPDRPLVSQDDRAAILGSLACVDAVVVFDEPTPAEVLERLRPDVFVKGGDYSVDSLPETDLVTRCGGQVVVLPYVEGHSSSGLMKEMMRRGLG